MFKARRPNLTIRPAIARLSQKNASKHLLEEIQVCRDAWSKLHYSYSSRLTWPLHGKNRAFSIIDQQRSEVKRAEPVASHLARRFCGRKFVGLGFGLLVLVLLPGNGGVIFKPIAPAGNGDGLGVVEETIQDRAGGGHIAHLRGRLRGRRLRGRSASGSSASGSSASGSSASGSDLGNMLFDTVGCWGRAGRVAERSDVSKIKNQKSRLQLAQPRSDTDRLSVLVLPQVIPPPLVVSLSSLPALPAQSGCAGRA